MAVNQYSKPMTSPGAIANRSGVIDTFLRSSALLGTTATGTVNAFGNAIGQSMNQIPASAVPAPYHAKYSELHTNLNEQSKLGSVGDAIVRGIGIRLEQAPIDAVTAAPVDQYGATQREATEIANKVHTEWKIAKTDFADGPVALFPAAGGIVGSIATAVAAVAPTIATNGAVNGRLGRLFNILVEVKRVDTIEFKLTVASGASLAFRATGQVMVYVDMPATLTRDIRG